MNPTKLPSYGGQALIEGVMMRGSRAVAMSMRAPDGAIVTHSEELGGIYKSALVKIPFLRGMVALWDALGLGMRALTRSANLQSGEDEKLEGPALYLTLATSLALSIGLFFLLPAGLGHFAVWLAAQTPVNLSPAATQWGELLIEGLTRLGLVIGYIWAVGKIPEIQRVFAYHGAEHKTINAFEAGALLTPQSVARYPLEHPRCGTAFLLVLVIVSILVFSLVNPLQPAGFNPLLWRLLTRVLLLPVLVGIAYEYLRWTADHIENPLVKILVKPNLALQRLTTREPSLEMLEVSIAAFETMRRAENRLLKVA